MPIIWGQGQLQQTPAVRALLQMNSTSPRSRKKKRRAKTRAAAPGAKRSARTSRKAAGKAARFVKGSAAAKRHMAKLRKLARKRR